MKSQEQQILTPEDQLHLYTLGASGHSRRLTFLLIGQYCTYRADYHTPDIAWRMLQVYQREWMQRHGINEISWLGQEMEWHDDDRAF